MRFATYFRERRHRDDSLCVVEHSGTWARGCCFIDNDLMRHSDELPYQEGWEEYNNEV
jgi:hypothetical protein